MYVPIKIEKAARFPWGTLASSIFLLLLSIFLFWVNSDPLFMVGILWLIIVPFFFIGNISAFIVGLKQWSSHEISVTYQCPYCRSKIELEATSCEHCGSAISAEAAPAVSVETSSTELVTCYKCGKQYSGNQNFCKYCGSQRVLGDS